MQDKFSDLPRPPGIEPVVGPRLWRWLLGLVLAVALAAGAVYVPIPPLYAFVPGPVEDVEGLIEIDGRTTYSSEGQLLMTTVRVDEQVTLVDWISAGFDPDKSIVSKEDFTGGLSRKELTRETQRQMRESKLHAQQVALGTLGFGPTGDGARIIRTVEDLPAHGILRPGDIIVSVNDRPVATTCDLTAAMRDVEAGDDIDVTVLRGGERETIELSAAEHPDDPAAAVVGVVVENVNYEFDAEFDVEIKTGEIGGPSAGLMFALALYDRLTPDDLTGGRVVAGTGTIGCDGGVGAISGIEQKVAGAEQKGADIFLVPLENENDALSAADEIDVVAVETFDDAVAYLEGL